MSQSNNNKLYLVLRSLNQDEIYNDAKSVGKLTSIVKRRAMQVKTKCIAPLP
ncbi:MAG: hypothetical protein HC847_06585 [Hydrococcus sp. RU_2_2]|nr:hypothetical protein [Hydrococcus sp. RU_2_2]NJP20936.1 hypothetical protein [Hydrococcus sp. CRU_1_1]